MKENNKLRMYTVPNFITLLNLACGILAIAVVLTKGDLKLAFWLIATAAVFDFADGMAARLLKQYSEIGKQLDSLADVVSFGVAPTFIAMAMMAELKAPIAAIFGTIILAIFSALRLAKFNVDETQTDSFVGLPTPACGLFFAALGYSFSELNLFSHWYIMAALILIFSMLLVAPIRMFSLKFKAFSFKYNILRYLFLAGSAILLILFRIDSIPIIIASYVVISTTAHLFKKRTEV